MHIPTRALRTSFVLAALAPISIADAADMSSSVIDIAARVPTICRVGFTAPATYETDTMLNLGVMDEFCNSARGYRVVMHHPAGLEGATAFVDGHAVALSAGTETVLIDSDVPTWNQSVLKVDLGSHADEVSTLYFRTDAKDAIY